MRKNDELTRVIKDSLDEIITATGNNYPIGDVCVGIAEIEINGVEYQVQLSLAKDRKVWTKENEVRFQEVVKIHGE